MSKQYLLAFLSVAGLMAQTPAAVDRLTERLDRLEQDNDALRKEIASLRTELAGLKETSQVSEARVAEQEQKKVESGSRFPVKLRGMAVANTFHNSAHANGVDTPTIAARTPGRSTAAMTFRQTVFGLEMNGPTFAGAKVSASIFADFYDGTTELNQFAPARLRTASFEMAWKTRSIRFAQDKPLFSQRDPNSLSYIGISPLTGSGNLWRWQPQLRFEQKLGSASGTQVRLQGAMVQTSEESGGDFSRTTIERRRPGLQGRFELAHHFSEERRIEIAPGFHVSESHIGPVSVPSRLVSVDWFASPSQWLELSGLFWSGENIHHFGSMRQGFVVVTPNQVRSVHSKGGWAQASVPFTPRVSLNLYGGIHDDRNRDLLPTGIAANRSGAANILFKLAPNILMSLEAMRIRTTYLTGGNQHINRYDLSVAYIF